MKKALSGPNLLLVGLLAAIAVLFFASLSRGDEKPSSEAGRYQITSCSTPSGWCVHVIDTRTGIVKKVEEEDFGKSFDQYK